MKLFKGISYLIFISVLLSNCKSTSMKNIIITQKAPAPIGPYSQAVMSGNTLYISGAIAIDPKTNNMVQENIEAETNMVMKNLGEILNAAGMNYSNVVKTTIFVTDLANFSKINTIYGSYFKDNFPARETVQVSALPKGANVEISAIAVK